jgi:DNA-binding response OmpR family regulator
MQKTSLILIVDDDPISTSIAKAALNFPGCSFALADNGTDGFVSALSLKPDIILLDVIMPGMDGFEVCRRIRQTSGISEVPVVMVTELDDKDSRIRGIEAGADDFISKPFNREELQARVRSILRLNRYRRIVAERARMDWLTENSDECYLMTDENDGLVFANRAALAMLDLDERTPMDGGVSFHAAAARRYTIHPEQAWEDWLPLVPATGQRERFLVHPETGDSTATWLQVEVHDEFEDSPPRRLIRLRDVTSQLSARQEMRTFHSMLSHKMRTPLYQLVTTVEMLREGNAILQEDERKELLDICAEGGNRLNAQIQDILQYIETPEERAEGHCEASELPRIISRITMDLEVPTPLVLMESDVSDSGMGLSCHAIEWIFTELIENSKKFHPSRTPSIIVRIVRNDQRSVWISVEDDGVNMPPDELEKVWLPYYQREKKFTGEVEGMGLGLSMVAVLAWKSGGTCLMRNREDGAGVRVELRLPATWG